MKNFEYDANDSDYEDEEFDNLVLLIAFARRPRINNFT